MQKTGKSHKSDLWDFPCYEIKRVLVHIVIALPQKPSMNTKNVSHGMRITVIGAIITCVACDFVIDVIWLIPL